MSRGLQVETEDLIQFSGQKQKKDLIMANNNNKGGDFEVDEPDLDPDEDDEDDDDDDDDEEESARTADEQMDYLESLDFCPHGAKCCIDSVITLFCVTLLG